MRMWSLEGCVGVVVLLLSLANAEEGLPINLGGPRKVTATVADHDGHYDVTVRMVPVQCFDPGLNARVNRAKAEGFAIEALARHLAGEAPGRVRLSVSGMRTIDTSLDGNRFRLTLRVTQKSLVLQPAAERSQETAPSAIGERKESTVPSSLFSVKGDYSATLHELQDALKTEVPSVPAGTESTDEFFRAVANSEELAEERFQALRADILVNKLLLKLERQELCDLLQAAHDEFLQELRRRVEAADSKAVYEE